MSERREIPGLWWLPNAQTDKWIGTLRLTPGESPKLETTVEKAFAMDTDAWPSVLHGCDQHSRPITLFFPSRPSATGSAVLSHHKWTAGYAVLGIELLGPQAFMVNSLHISMQHLYEWVGVTGFERWSATMGEYTVNYRQPEKLVFNLTDEQQVEIACSFNFEDKLREKRLAEDVWIS